MALLMKPEPFTREVDRLFDAFFGAARPRGRRWVPPMDLVEAEDHFVLKADLPGLAEDDVSIEIQDGTLRISGERQAEQRGARARLVPRRALVRQLQPHADAARRASTPTASRPSSTAACSRCGSPSPRSASRAASRSGRRQRHGRVEGTAQRQLEAHAQCVGRTLRAGEPAPRVRTASTSTPATGAPARASFVRPTARCARPPSCRWPPRATVKTLQSGRGGRRSATRWCSATPSTCSSSPAHELIARAGRAARVHGLARRRSSPTPAATRCSRWATARWPRRSSGSRGSGESMGALDRGGGRALPLLPRRRGALHGPRDLDGGAGRARLRHRAGLRRVHALPRRARLHGALDGAHPPLARPLRRLARRARARRASCCSGSSRAASTRTCAPSRPPTWRGAGVDGIAIGGSLGQEKDADARGGGLVAARAAGRAPAPPARHRRRGRHRARRRRGHRQLRLRHAHAPGPPRHGAGAGPRARAGGSTSPRRASRRAASRSPTGCPCPACREHTRGYLHYLVRAGELTRRGCSRCTT